MGLRPPKGKTVYGYDVNSLYPTVMKNKAMPIGNITYFEGDINDVDKKAFGFFEVEITAPREAHIKHKIIQTKVGRKAPVTVYAQYLHWVVEKRCYFLKKYIMQWRLDINLI